MNKLFFKRAVLVLILLIFLSCEGCEAFRKKFVRKKHLEDETVEQVILEPQVYPEAVYNNSTLYKNYYTLYRAWYADLLDSLKEEASNKKQIQCFDEVLKNLNEMKNLLKQEKQQEIDSYIQNIFKNKEQLVESVLKNAVLSQLRISLSGIEKKIRTDFNYKKIKDYIKEQR